jgi:hypothetical protein
MTRLVAESATRLLRMNQAAIGGTAPARKKTMRLKRDWVESRKMAIRKVAISARAE